MQVLTPIVLPGLHMPSRIAMGPSQCAVERCDHFAKIHSLCLMHYRHFHLQHRSPVATEAMTSQPKEGETKLKLKNRNRKCRSEGCLSYARSGGFCTRHGGGRKCKVENCGTASQTGGYCRLHGGGSRCRIPECQQFARIRGLCLQHNRGHADDANQVSDADSN